MSLRNLAPIVAMLAATAIPASKHRSPKKKRTTEAKRQAKARHAAKMARKRNRKSS